MSVPRSPDPGPGGKGHGDQEPGAHRDVPVELQPGRGSPPTEVSARSWIWTAALDSSFQSQARSAISVIASSLPGIQRDNSDIFLSGIFFGIAGGAAVSVMPAWLDASDRRKARREDKSGEEKHEVKP